MRSEESATRWPAVATWLVTAARPALTLPEKAARSSQRRERERRPRRAAAARCAWRESAFLEAARRGSRRSALSVARLLRFEGDLGFRFF